MADDVRIQVRKNDTENTWADVGNKAGNESVPVNGLITILNPTPATDVSLLATKAKQLPDNHNVTVSNPTANPETGLAKNLTLTDESQVTKIKETTPVDTTKFNSSTLISYNASGECVYIDETFAGITYRTTFTRSSMVVTLTLPISASVQQ